MTLLLQVGPLQPHNQATRHFQGCLKHQALSLIAQGPVLNCHNTVHFWHWCNTIFPLPKQHSLKTPWPPNFPAYAKHWRFLNLSLCNLPVSAQGCPLLMMDTALRSWIRSPTNYPSIAISDETHATKVWDRSYSNELGRLCQGIGTGDKAGGKQVAGTNTFHLIPYSDILHHKHKEIIYMKVVCEIQEGKIVPGSQSGET
jgi:hypothetical protein